ncbi:hypothetical protein EXIGLDRAFT_838472, partial [Exidia glandulosa HHB12029]
MSEETLLPRSFEELEYTDELYKDKHPFHRWRTASIVLALIAVGVAIVHFASRLWEGENICRGQILVRHFDSFSGLGSEYGIFLRAAALSAEMGWTVVPVTSGWIYGDLDNFFVPPSYGCKLPDDLLVNASHYTSFGTRGWESAQRLQLTRDFNQLLQLETLIRNRSINTAETGRLDTKQRIWSLDKGHLTLPYGESVPQGVEKAFLEQAEALKRLWVPNSRMQAQIDRLAARVELHNLRPTRRPVVAVQVRLGDKKTELEDLQRVGSHMQFDDMKIYFCAIEVAVGRLYESDITRDPFPRATKDDQKPLVVVMTAERGVTEQLIALDTDNQFDFVLTPSSELTPEEQEEYDRTFNATSKIVRRWDQHDLEKASLSLRLALTRQLIAELTVYSRLADAFVVSGNSNLG